MTDRHVAGCVALRSLSEDVAEVKRLFVRPHSRGRGVGRALMERLLDEARTAGYRAVRLETMEAMREAQALYRSLGFTQIAPYADHAHSIFMELQIDGASLLQDAMD